MSLYTKYSSGVNAILELLTDKDSDLLKEFIRQFYAFSYNSVLKLRNDFLLSIARSLYDFSSERNRGQSKVRLFPLVNQKGAFTIVEVVNDNYPFLVDSILEAVKSFGLGIYHYTNAVLQIERQDSKISKILPRDPVDSDIQESIVCFIIKSIDPEVQVKLQSEIERTLETVRYCVNDWQLMLEQADKLQKQLSSSSDKDSSKRGAELLSWLQQDNFVFLGYQEYKAQGNVLKLGSDGLGMKRIKEFVEEEKVILCAKEHILVTRSNLISIVHRRTNIDCIAIRQFDGEGCLTTEYCFLGLFASVTSLEDIRNIPVISEKVSAVEKRSGFAKNGHNGKSLLSVMQSFSREDMFRSTEDELFEISMGILLLSIAPQVKLFVRYEVTGNFINCIVFVPKNRSSTVIARKIHEILEYSLNGKIIASDYNMTNESSLVRMQFIVQSIDDSQVSEQHIRNIESRIAEATKQWSDRLLDFSKEKGELCDIIGKYLSVFPIDYQEYFDPKTAYHDIIMLEKFALLNQTQVDLYLTLDSKHYQLKIYTANGGGISLSAILNIIKNTGMSILLHYSYRINLPKEVRIHYFILSGVKNSFADEQVEEQFEIMLTKIFTKEIENDYFNSLVLLAGLHCREVLLLRALSKYLKQISFGYSQSYIQKTLSSYPEIVRCLVELFNSRFNPDLDIDREETTVFITDKLDKLFLEVTDVIHDYVLRHALSLIMAIVRTNYYLSDRSFLSFKFDSSKIPNLPLPRPFREIYVYSTQFEAIHLRGNKVSRGGLRWSDRTEDFRTEVLGLMKAQMTKNSVIVPAGAKGGFILKHVKTVDRDELQKIAVKCYQKFLRGLLDVTDNIINNESVISPRIISYDDRDHYLVVAADKGTSSFSDYANAISKEYNFWMDDAFASGGSYGYDHKKMGITSRGAWVALQRHFWQLGRNIEDVFSAIAIGDMAGDLFGNGMLLSQKIELIGAFNHIHIFVDPTPNLETSFKERQRMFNLPTSTWLDYDSSVISKGGGIFERKAKSITLSSEIRSRFDISEKVITPNELIRKIMMAKVDVLWNAGIGTFIKSSKESNGIVLDRANDALRVDGKDLKTAIVIEGGNLGCTQLGRIEYSEHGGHINTDFMDNSGGVICSDFEVNIKIAFKVAIESTLLSLEQRNEILEGMTSEIVHMVLDHHNKLETKALMIETSQAQERLEQHCRLLQSLEKSGRINRQIEFLPNDEEMTRMLNEIRGFKCPQIAVLMSYARMAIKDEVVSSNLMNDVMLSHYLADYFPQLMRDRFIGVIERHPLRRDIIATCITNEIVSRMGCVFINHIVENTGMRVELIVKIYVLMSHVYGLYDLWAQIDSELDGKIEIGRFVEIIREVQGFVGQAVFWCMRNMHRLKDIEARFDIIRKNVNLLQDNLSNVLDEQSLAECKQKTKDTDDSELIQKVLGLKFLSNALDIIYLAEDQKLSVFRVAKLYFALKSSMHFPRIRDIAKKMELTSSYWQRISIRDLLDDLNECQILLTAEVLNFSSGRGMKDEEMVPIWLNNNHVIIDTYINFLNKINVSQLDLSKLMILVKRLESIVVQGGSSTSV